MKGAPVRNRVIFVAIMQATNPPWAGEKHTRVKRTRARTNKGNEDRRERREGGRKREEKCGVRACVRELGTTFQVTLDFRVFLQPSLSSS